jgi:hypothetical protein
MRVASDRALRPLVGALAGLERGAIPCYQIGGCFKGGLQILK